MSYQVLARKWRPQTFAEMVGQRHVLTALVNALDNQRLHHAYLFTGTRGVGKTTLARLFAKSLNCEVGVSSTPCGECSACREIAENRFIDLIEVDAASRTKVEDTRELLENVQYQPTRGRYKVYLIDEVHMLSNHSFNALLKTLEEPPPHVKFLLATTDPQKLPVTVLSRCLQFNLKSMTPDMVMGHLKDILTREHIPFDDAALLHLAKAAQGSMRDALSLTDQAMAFGQNTVKEADVAEMLGTVDTRQILALLDAVLQQDAPQLLRVVAHLAEFAPHWQHLMNDILALLHQLTVLQMAPGFSAGLHHDALQAMAQRSTPDDVQLYYQLGLQAHKDIALAPDARQGFEMALLRMIAFTPDIKRVYRPSISANTAVNTPEPAPTGSSPVSEVASQPESDLAPTTETAPEPQEEAQSDKQVQPDDQAQPVPQETEPAFEQPQEHSPESSQAPYPQHDEHPVAQTPDAPPWAPDESFVESSAQPTESVVEDSVGMSPETEALGTENPAPIADPIHAEVPVQAEESDDQEETLSWQEQPLDTDDEPLHVAAPDAAAFESLSSEPQPADNTLAYTAATQRALDQIADDPSVLGDVWPDLIPALELQGVLHTLVANSALLDLRDGTLELQIDPAYERLHQASYWSRLVAALTNIGIEVERVNVRFEPCTSETLNQRQQRQRREAYAQAKQALQEDPFVQALAEDFDGELLTDTIEPVIPPAPETRPGVNA